MHGELATVLTGRHLDMTVFPLGLQEIFDFKSLNIGDKLDLVAKKIEIKSLFNEYLNYGGFPEVVLSEEKEQLLLAYFDDILVKDIEKRYEIRGRDKLRILAKFYLTNISSFITFNALKNHFKGGIDTIERFSSYLEETNMIFFIKRFSFKFKEQEKSPRKVYSIDVGLANAIGFKFSEDIGKIAENLVAIELKKRTSLDSNVEIYYWQNVQKKEVDFVVKKKQKVEQLIQVCWDINSYKTKKREISNLIKASEEFKCKNLLIITQDKEEEEIIENNKIKYLPLWKYIQKYQD